jgi:hypothetical protein
MRGRRDQDTVSVLRHPERFEQEKFSYRSDSLFCILQRFSDSYVPRTYTGTSPIFLCFVHQETTSAATQSSHDSAQLDQ